MAYRSQYTDHQVRDVPEPDDRLRMWGADVEQPGNYMTTELANARHVREFWGFDVTTDNLVDSEHFQAMFDRPYGGWVYSDRMPRSIYYSGGSFDITSSQAKMLAMLATIIDKNQQIADLQNEVKDLTHRQNDLIECTIAAVDENSGCAEGKTETLTRRGIARPAQTHRMSVEFTAPVDSRHLPDLVRLMNDIVREGGLTDRVREDYAGYSWPEGIDLTDSFVHEILF